MTEVVVTQPGLPPTTSDETSVKKASVEKANDVVSVTSKEAAREPPSFNSEDDPSSTSQRSAYIASSRATTLRIDREFNENLKMAQDAIAKGYNPQLIPAGSSGSYFVRDEDGRYLAVFKPKDEEPFAPLNPKWPKFFQRVLCFCCFGRACLIPNNGYLSETGASLVDNKLRLNVVPKTRVVKLSSPAFYYSRCCGRQMEPRPKEGSYQLFMHGYESAEVVLGRWEYDPSLLSDKERDKFLLLFQKMCVIDYIIRNTDRHMDNWMIRHVPGKVLEVAAIDNGLAFPVKHPECASRLRQFPFKWAQLHWAHQPWNAQLRDYLLTTCTPRFVNELCSELKQLFKHDSDSNRMLINNQMRVVRGQLYNLREALAAGETPAQMSKRAPVLVVRRFRHATSEETWDEAFKLKDVDYGSPACC